MSAVAITLMITEAFDTKHERPTSNVLFITKKFPKMHRKL